MSRISEHSKYREHSTYNKYHMVSKVLPTKRSTESRSEFDLTFCEPEPNKKIKYSNNIPTSLRTPLQTHSNSIFSNEDLAPLDLFLKTDPPLTQTVGHNESAINSQTQVEIEVRFGYWSPNDSTQFSGQLLDLSLFFEVRQHLEGLVARHPGKVNRQVTDSLVEINQNGIRRITTDKSVQFEYKSKIGIYDIHDWGLRFSKSIEMNIAPPTNFTPSKVRRRSRTTYIDTRPESYFYGFRIDLTEVSDNKNIQYELELEQITSSLPIEKWIGAITTIYGWSINAKTKYDFISITERFFIARLVNHSLGNVDSGLQELELNMDLYNKPKTLKSLDLITSQPNDYAVSIKADGLHKLLVIYDSYIYLCSPKFDIIKIGRYNSIGLTIIEGEYIPSSSLFLSYDCLVYDNTRLINLPFIERYSKLSSIKLDHLTYYKCQVKQFWFPSKAISSHPSSTIVMTDWKEFPAEYTKASNDLQFPIDGIIFQSLGSYYSNTYKWKPLEYLTVDFYLHQIDSNTFFPYVVEDNQLVRFGNSPIFIKDSKIDNISINHRIVEFRFSNDKWIPIRIRLDRHFPNSKRVADKNFDLINKPIALTDVLSIFNSL